MRTFDAEAPAARPAAFFLGVTASFVLFVLAVALAAPADASLTDVAPALTRQAEETGTGWSLKDALLFALLLGACQATAGYFLGSVFPRNAHTALAAGFFVPVAVLMLMGFVSEFGSTMADGRSSYYRPLVVVVICGMSFVVPILAAALAGRNRFR